MPLGRALIELLPHDPAYAAAVNTAPQERGSETISSKATCPSATPNAEAIPVVIVNWGRRLPVNVWAVCVCGEVGGRKYFGTANRHENNGSWADEEYEDLSSRSSSTIGPCRVLPVGIRSCTRQSN